jgi:hypothetical protein
MPLGKVESIDPIDNTKGTVREDETNEVFNYSDDEFATKNLAVGDSCSFDVDYTLRQPVATNLQKVTIVPTKVINREETGPLTILAGETVIVKEGGNVKGDIKIINGKLVVAANGATEGRTDISEGGRLVVKEGGNVKGDIHIVKGSALKIIGGGKVTGNIYIPKANSLNRFILGNADGPGSITGALDMFRVRNISITAESKINCNS